jgi:hypothetical protein
MDHPPGSLHCRFGRLLRHAVRAIFIARLPTNLAAPPRDHSGLGGTSVWDPTRGAQRTGVRRSDGERIEEPPIRGARRREI